MTDVARGDAPSARRAQTRRGSLLESLTNVAVGFLLALAVQELVYPALGIITTSRSNLLIAAIFTAVSLLRSYLLRRAFEHAGRR